MATQKTGDSEFAYITGALTAQYEEHEFNFNSTGMKIQVAGGTLEFSFDGKEVHGELAAGDKEDFFGCHKSKIYLKGSGTVKVWAWI